MFNEVKKTLQELYDHQKNNGFCTKEIDGTSGFILSGRFGNVINGRNINSALYRIRDSYNEEELRKVYFAHEGLKNCTEFITLVNNKKNELKK
jgi:uncharacterized protein (UPF0297 family)